MLIFDKFFRKTILIIALFLSVLTIVLDFVLSGWSVGLSDIWILLLILVYVFVFFIISNKSSIGIRDNILEIKWLGWLSKVAVPDTEIEKIILAKLYEFMIR